MPTNKENVLTTTRKKSEITHFIYDHKFRSLENSWLVYRHPPPIFYRTQRRVEGIEWISLWISELNRATVLYCWVAQLTDAYTWQLNTASRQRLSQVFRILHNALSNCFSFNILLVPAYILAEVTVAAQVIPSRLFGSVKMTVAIRLRPPRLLYEQLKEKLKKILTHALCRFDAPSTTCQARQCTVTSIIEND